MKFEWEILAPFAKACPFCGSKDIVTETKENFYSKPLQTCTFIRCVNCGVSIYGDPVINDDGSNNTTYENAYNQVLKIWNRRS